MDPFAAVAPDPAAVELILVVFVEVACLVWSKWWGPREAEAILTQAVAVTFEKHFFLLQNVDHALVLGA